MLGAIVGDIVGSQFEHANHLSKSFELFSPESALGLRRQSQQESDAALLGLRGLNPRVDRKESKALSGARRRFRGRRRRG